MKATTALSWSYHAGTRTLDNIALSEGEVERHVTIVAGIELGPIKESPLVVGSHNSQHGTISTVLGLSP